MEDQFEHARENAKSWLASIEDMLDGLHDWQGAAEAEGWTGPHKDEFGATYFKDETDGATWACASWRELCEAHDIDAERSEDGEQTIHESVLSVMVRDGWRSPGCRGIAPGDDPIGADEYEILLTTGGPALRIWGKLGNYGEPGTAELQMQDWGTPWGRYPAPEVTLLEFVRCFYFGD